MGLVAVMSNGVYCIHCNEFGHDCYARDSIQSYREGLELLAKRYEEEAAAVKARAAAGRCAHGAAVVCSGESLCGGGGSWTS